MLDNVDAYRYMYYFIKKNVSLSEFEQWLYNHDELEEILGQSEYIEFVSRDYKGKYAYQETEKQIKEIITIGYFEQERIVSYLSNLIQNPINYLEIAETLYDEYCDGYSFLRYIAMTYITTSDEYKEMLKQDQIKLQDYRVLINKEAVRLLKFFERNELKIEVEHEYIDLRKHEDRIELHSINEMLKEQRDS
ncbi:hypothetical protein ACFPPD_25870 [Cohnella suwonensis]|uniref:DUF4375 domain-containing protein n=1 Tax=Cohnella suwonensis TaxID=696072 RepID=A0ABW0M1V1_9BACL